MAWFGVTYVTRALLHASTYSIYGSGKRRRRVSRCGPSYNFQNNNSSHDPNSDLSIYLSALSPIYYHFPLAFSPPHFLPHVCLPVRMQLYLLPSSCFQSSFGAKSNRESAAMESNGKQRGLSSITLPIY